MTAVYYEKSTGRQVKQLARFPYYKSDEQLNLLEYQDNKERFLINDNQLQADFALQYSQFTTRQKLQLYFSLFKGRRDVYAKSYINQEGNIQYYPSYHYGWRNLPPEKRIYAPLTDEVLKNHLRDNSRIGLFPISQSDTCSFLAIDFDKKDWRDAVTAVRQAADQQGVEAYVEISRSGNDAHVWFFFDNDIPCKQARDFGKTIIKLAMQKSKSISFSSFDRMFPNQDLLPKGGFGNLIALPLQGDSYKEGRTVFVDRDFKPYENQWKYLQDVNRISSKQLENVLTIENESKKDSKELSLAQKRDLEKPF